MAWLRHAGRHVLQTVIDELDTHLTALGWMDEDDLPFGLANAAVVALSDKPIIDGDTLAKNITAGTMAVSIGDEIPPEEQELGGPLSTQEYPIFVDIFQPTRAAALALATDVRDILMGRLPNTRRSIELIDQKTGDVEEGWRIHFEEVERTSPNSPHSVNWQVVKTAARVDFQEVQY